MKGVHCEAVLEGVVVCHQFAILWGIICRVVCQA
jgi:hypothetical protein